MSEKNSQAVQSQWVRVVRLLGDRIDVVGEQMPPGSFTVLGHFRDLADAAGLLWEMRANAALSRLRFVGGQLVMDEPPAFAVVSPLGLVLDESKPKTAATEISSNPGLSELLEEGRRLRDQRRAAEEAQRLQDEATRKAAEDAHWNDLLLAVYQAVPEPLRCYAGLRRPEDWSASANEFQLLIEVPGFAAIMGLCRLDYEPGYGGERSKVWSVSSKAFPVYDSYADDGRPEGKLVSTHMWAIPDWVKKDDGTPTMNLRTQWWSCHSLPMALAEAEVRGDLRTQPELLEHEIPF